MKSLSAVGHMSCSSRSQRALEDQMLAAIAVILSREAPPGGGFARITVPVDNVGEAVEKIQRVLQVSDDHGLGVVRLGDAGC